MHAKISCFTVRQNIWCYIVLILEKRNELMLKFVTIKLKSHLIITSPFFKEVW